MRYALLFGLIVIAMGCGKGPEALPQPPKVAQRHIEGLDHYALGTPISYDNVTIIPVSMVDTEKRQGDDYISLQEAKKNGWVEIVEMPQGQTVNELYVSNLGKRPLILLAGELLLGGKQDRVVAKDTVVPPGEKMSVPVFCVEHGRWTGASSKFEFSGSMVPQKVRSKVNFGEQQDVWDGVSEYNKSSGMAGDTTSVRGGMYDAKVQARVDSDWKRFADALDGQQNVVGFVYVVDGKIESLELFGNESLLKASREPLLRGFVADAAVRPAGNSSVVDLDVVGKFVKDSLSGERQQTQLGRGQATWTVNGSAGMGIESTLPAAAMPKSGPHDSAMFLHGSYSPEKSQPRQPHQVHRLMGRCPCGRTVSCLKPRSPRLSNGPRLQA